MAAESAMPCPSATPRAHRFDGSTTVDDLAFAATPAPFAGPLADFCAEHPNHPACGLNGRLGAGDGDADDGDGDNDFPFAS